MKKEGQVREELFIPSAFEVEKMSEIIVFSEWFEKHFKSDDELFEKCIKAYRLLKSELALSMLVKVIATDKCGTKKEVRRLKSLLKNGTQK